MELYIIGKYSALTALQHGRFLCKLSGGLDFAAGRQNMLGCYFRVSSSCSSCAGTELYGFSKNLGKTIT